MKKKTLLTLLAACLLTLGLSSCCYDGYYGYGHRHYGHSYRGGGHHHYHGGHSYYYGPNAQVAE